MTLSDDAEMIRPSSREVGPQSARVFGTALWAFVLGLCLITQGVMAAADPVQKLLAPVTRADGLASLSSMNKAKALGLVRQFFTRHSDDAEVRRLLMNQLSAGGEKTRALLLTVAVGRQPGLAEEAYRVLLQGGHARLLNTDMLRRLAAGKPLALALISAEQLMLLEDLRVRPIYRRLVRNEKAEMALRVACVRGLGEFGGAGSVQFLTRTYQWVPRQGSEASLALRRALLEALAKRGGVDAVPILIDALRLSDLWDTAVENLVKIGGNALPGLKLVLETGDKQVEPGVLAVLFELGGIDSRRFMDMLKSTSRPVRARAKWILVAFPDPQLVPELLRLWKSPSGYPTRSELLDILVPYYSDERVQELFGQALDSKEVAVVETALRVISGMGDQAFSEQILEIAEDEPHPEIRIRAIESMVELGLFDARDLLERMLLYEDFQVRKVAAWALRWLGDPTQTAPALWDARDGRHPELRPLLVHAAAKLAAKTVLTDSRPAHYGVAPSFDVQEVYDEADAVRRDFKFRDETIEIITMGSDDEAVIVFLPLHYSDPAPILQALKDLADDRRVIFFRKKRPQGIAPHRVNLVMGRWFQEAADAILNDLQVTEPVDVLGWSMGSAWATLFCAAKPERCRRLLLASPMSLDFVFWEQTVPQLVRQLMPAPFDEDVVFLESVKNRFAGRAWGIYYEQYLGRIQVGDSEASTALTQLRSPMLYKVPEAGFLDVERAFKKLVTNHVGITVVVGGKDLFSGEWIRAAKLGNGQGVRLHRVPGIGHFALYEDPETTGKLLADGLD